MRKKIILLVLMLTIGYASVVISLSTNGKVSVAFDSSNLQVVFKKVTLNNEESPDVIISEGGKSFVYIADNLNSIDNTANIEYSLKNQSSYYDANVVVSCSTDYNEKIEYSGNTLNQIIEVKADEGYTDTLTTKLKDGNTSGESVTVKCTLIVDPLSRDSIMLGKEYNVDFNANGGSTIDSSIIVKYYEKYGELPIPSRKGYEFLGWYTDDGVEVDSSSLVKVKNNHTLIARWKKNTFKLITDVDGDGRADIGDEIEIGTERFYITSQTATEINALAKHNLKVGGIYNGTTLERTISPSEEGYGKQDAGMVGFSWQDGKKYGTVELSSVNGWPNSYGANIDIKQYEGPVKDALYGESGYEMYLQENIPDVSVRLMTKRDVEELINNGNTLNGRQNIETKADAKGYSWLYSTTYWLQTVSSSSKVWGIYSHGSSGSFSYLSDDGYGDKYWYGIRPVVTIPVEVGDVFNITLNANGGNVSYTSKEIKYGDEYGELPIPTKKDCEFLGWYTESGNKIESTTIMNMYKDHILTARWRNTQTIYMITNDLNYNGEAEVGDEIKVGTESFYVISHTDTELNALAKYNLKVGKIRTSSSENISVIQTTEEGYGRQDQQMRGYISEKDRYGTVKFSNKAGWVNTNNTTIDIRNEVYRVGTGVTAETITTLDALYGDNGYENYIKGTINNASVRLITKREIEVLVNDGNELANFEYINSKASAKGYSWLYNTTYWVQNSYTEEAFQVWHVDIYGCFFAEYYGYDALCGVRPVITIPES